MTQRDFNYAITALDQRAQGTITIDDYTLLRGAFASGTILVDDYTKLIEAAAVGSITYGVPVDGDTVLVNGTTCTKVAAAPGANEFSNIAELEALCEAVAGINSTENGTVVSLTAATPGSAGNALTLSLGGGNTGTMAISGATFTGGQDHATITVGADTLTQGVGFTAETDDATTAENIKVAIHALAGVSATRSSETVTIVNDAIGTVGNTKALTNTGTAGGLTLSGATLAGGVNPGSVVIEGTTYTEQTDFEAITSNAATATDLAAAITLQAGFDASAVGNVVTVVWTTPGSAGNAKTMSSTFDGLGLTLSGATLEGGADQTYSETFSYDDVEDLDELEIELDVSEIGAAITLDVAVEISMNKNDADAWDQIDTFTQVTTESNESIQITQTGMYARFKMVVGGNGTVTGNIHAIAR